MGNAAGHPRLESAEYLALRRPAGGRPSNSSAASQSLPLGPAGGSCAGKLFSGLLTDLWVVSPSGWRWAEPTEGEHLDDDDGTVSVLAALDVVPDLVVDVTFAADSDH